MKSMNTPICDDEVHNAWSAEFCNRLRFFISPIPKGKTCYFRNFHQRFIIACFEYNIYVDIIYSVLAHFSYFLLQILLYFLLYCWCQKEDQHWADRLLYFSIHFSILARRSALSSSLASFQHSFSYVDKKTRVELIACCISAFIFLFWQEDQHWADHLLHFIIHFPILACCIASVHGVLDVS